MTHLVSTACCSCGKGVQATQEQAHVAHCIECGREAASVTHDAFLIRHAWYPAVDTLQRRTVLCDGGFDFSEHEADGQDIVFPAPEVTSRDGGFQVWPAAVLSLAEFAREADWEVCTQYSRGNVPHSTTGRPGVLKEMIGVRFGDHPMTTRRAYAVYSRTASGGTWGWSSVMAWGPALPPFGGFSITDLRRYLSEAAVWPDASLLRWVAEVREAATVKKAADKARPKAAPKPKEGMS